MSVVSSHTTLKSTQLATDNLDWWRGAVIYQVYPRSYQDTTGNGMGDLAGITQRMEYIASLGVDAIWVSPFFLSPMKDFGYDVSNYRTVDPQFGTLESFDAMVHRAHSLGIKVIIDLVLSHSSDQHPWFLESRQNTSNARADWYVWSDPKPDGTPPNNWLSIFGGSAWEWDGRREQYYLHNFLASQPDLNFHNAEVRHALLDVARFWLERGVDGFRLDTINFYIHDKELRDNPALPKAERNSNIAPSVNPYNHQRHLYSKNQPENLEFLAEFRKLMNQFPGSTLVGEVGDAQQGLEIAAEYTAGDERVHMCYAFEFLTSDSPSASRVAEVLKKEQALSQNSWTCWALSNHDVIRHATRWSMTSKGFDQQSYKLYLAMQMSFRGSVCLYQGEELGLDEANVPYERLQDPYGIKFWPEFKGRDGCRTPMVWSHSEPNAGFSAVEPWLPIGEHHLRLSASLQDHDETSTLNFYRRFIAFRAAHPELRHGEISDIEHHDNVLSFVRAYGDVRLFCAFNLGDQTAKLTLSAESLSSLSVTGFTHQLDGDELTLEKHQAFFAHIA